MEKIKNPILPGFNPDPSLVRLADDYYIATSTFEWFPGVQIHHSRDLVHWRLLTYPLTRTSQLDLQGSMSSCGVWAPCLSYSDGLFYLIYTNTKTRGSNFKDCHNYLVTANDIRGPWSEPVYLNSSGFDPSVFHDDDGRKWLVNMLWDHRYGTDPFAGIALQEYDPKSNRLIGPVKNIFKGTALGSTEGPHLYKYNGYYYLMTAEGGTGYGHAVTMARAKKIDGSYEVDPANPILTSRHNPELELQKAGHGSLVQTQNKKWYLAHLCGRPLKSSVEPKRRCMLGRETAIQECYWTKDGWLRVKGGNTPAVIVDAPGLPEHKFDSEPVRDDFDSDVLSVHFNSLRVPVDQGWLSLKERPGFLRLKGRESLASQHEQSLLARRLTSFKCQAATCIEFEPEHFQQMAGLVCLYDTQNYFYLRISHDESLGKHLGIATCDNNKYDELIEYEVKLKAHPKCYLRADFDDGFLQFSYSLDGKNWTDIGPSLDATRLSDEYCNQGCFTGSFVGLCCQDLAGTRKHADFDFFEYQELE